MFSNGSQHFTVMTIRSACKLDGPFVQEIRSTNVSLNIRWVGLETVDTTSEATWQFEHWATLATQPGTFFVLLPPRSASLIRSDLSLSLSVLLLEGGEGEEEGGELLLRSVQGSEENPLSLSKLLRKPRLEV